MPTPPRIGFAARVPRWGLAALLAAPALLVFATVGRLGVNVVFTDEVFYVPFIRLVIDGGDWHPWIWLQHNEHRLVPFKLLMAALAGPTAWSQKAEMWASAVLMVLVAAFFWPAYRRSGGGAMRADVLAFVPVAWMACSLSQYENLLCGLQACFPMSSLFALLALLLLAGSRWYQPLFAVVCAAAGAFTLASGFVVWPAGLIVLWGRRERPWRWALWLGAGAAAAFAYSRSYQVPPHTQPIQWSPYGVYRVVKLWLSTLGAPLAGGSWAWAWVLGALLAAAAVVLAWRWLAADQEERAAQALPLALIAFGFLFAALIAVGRAFLPGGDPVASRYTTLTLFAWVGVYFLLLRCAREEAGRGWVVAACSLLLPALVAADLHGIQAGREAWRLRLEDQYALQTVERQSDRVVSRFGAPQLVREYAAYLRRKRLSAYAEPQRVLLLLDPLESLPVAPVAAGATAEQALSCPLSIVHDVGVLVMPAPAPARFAVTVAADGRELVTQEVSLGALSAPTWARIQLPGPLAACAGRRLTVRVMSNGVGAGSEVRVAAAPAYYSAPDLRVGGVPMAGRRLGLALNGFRFGLLP